MSRDMIFVLGSPKSGTTLVQSLLDGHEDLFVLPSEMRYFQHRGYPSLVYQHQGVPSIADFEVRTDLTTVRDRILNHREFTSLRPDSPGNPPRKISVDGIDVNGFYEVARSIEPSSDADLIESLVRTMTSHVDYVDADRIDDLAFVEKTPLQEEYATTLDRWFPNAKFVHVTRNPYALLTSLRKRSERSGGYPDIERRMLGPIEASYYFLEVNRRAIDDYHVLNYDELLRSPEHVVRDLTDFLDIDFTESMTTPTIATEPWGGNSMYDQSFESISQEPLTRWKEEISDFEIRVVNTFFDSIIDAYYPNERTGAERSAVWPQSGEGLTTYVSNRVTYYKKRLK